jgi:outer membrane protein OmpA-like peptidoglycan-associated protein
MYMMSLALVLPCISTISQTKTQYMTNDYFKKLLFITLFFASAYSYAQGVNEVLKASQFGGISNVSYNPAIADNRFLVDINLISLGGGLENNYIGLDRNTLTKHNLFSDPNFQDDHLKERLNGRPKRVYAGMQVQGPLSFMFSFGKNRNNKNAIGVSWHANTILNVDGMDERFARSAYYGLGTKADSITGFNYQNLNNKNFSAKTLAWADFGITYSRVVFDNGNHMLKAGVTGKFIVGIAGGYISSKNIDYRIRNYDTIDINHSDISYGHSDIISESQITQQNVMNSLSKVSFGADLGLIYEWRPDHDKFQYEMDCKKWWQTDRNRYKLAVGFSVIDIGRVKFAKPGNVRNYSADIQGYDVANSGITDVRTFDSVFHSMPANFKADAAGEFKIWLPTRFNLFLDWEIYKGLGLNLNSTISPVLAKDFNQVHYPTSVTLTPRYDWKWFGAYIPLSYNEYGNFGAGVGLRAGPLFVSSSNIITAFASKVTFAMNIQAGIKITIPNMKQKDHDKDGVSNKKDKCKKEKGTCLTQGCPDRDGDGITDDVDKCPDVPGPVETQGCPDRDKDGVYDMNDSCPDVAGPVELHGCPDTDGDGILDKNDECPTEKGPAALNGCPDRDNDGVADKNDACPDVPGDKAHKGCPDTDGDGLYDNEDSCPRVKGPIENHGCPYADTDGDGVLDKDDACPSVFGVAENKGCPALSKKELETVKYAFDNLEFETGKDVIRTKSFVSLNGLAKLLIDKGYGLKIEGHTDNVGKADMNLDLSVKRAESVKKYLMSKNVDGNKLETAGYGLTKPIADNKTAEGRQKNRRVEMTIIFK